MRRRWHWPLLDDADPDDIVAAWFVWLIIGFLCLGVPALIIGTDKHDQVAIGVGSLPFWLLIVYGVPVAIPVIGVCVWAFAPLARALIPRRVTEPVRQDIRDHYR